MVDLKGQYQTLKGEIDAALLQALSEGQYILGPNVQAFEREAADYLGSKHAISCASGTDALHLSLIAAGIGNGDEVITTAFTFIATAEAIRHAGAIPVFVDINPETLNIDASKISASLSNKTRAIISVHLFGQPADMDEIQAITEQYDLFLLEDCAQSFGSFYHRRMTGTIGGAGAFSFYPGKNLGCYGDGGLIATDDDEIARQVKIYRNHGSNQQYHHDVIGFNSRLDELQAVVLRIKLKYIDEYNNKRLHVAQTYNRLLAGTELQTPLIPEDRDHIFHQYTLLSDRRDQIRVALIARQIACAVYYPIPLHQQKAFSDTRSEPLPISESVTRRCLSLPIYPEMVEQQVQSVCEVVLNT